MQICRGYCDVGNRLSGFHATCVGQTLRINVDNSNVQLVIINLTTVAIMLVLVLVL